MSTDTNRTAKVQLDFHALLSAGFAPALAGAFSGAAIVLGAGAVSPPPAGAAVYLGATTSYYVTTAGHTTLSTAGCYQAGVSGVADVVLDFGDQIPVGNSSDSWGAQDPINGLVLPDENNTVASISGSAKAFTNGYNICNSTPVYVGIGTNNSGPYVGTGTGDIWGSLVGDVANFYTTSKLHIQGADDIEMGFSSAGSAKSWIGGSTPVSRGGAGHAGFQLSGRAYYDYGASTGCASVCSNGWTRLEVYNVAYGLAGAEAMPEMYFPGEITDWRTVEGSEGYISYSAAMATGNSGESPATAWTWLEDVQAETGLAATAIRDI